jgi:hypothetical protein
MRMVGVATGVGDGAAVAAGVGDADGEADGHSVGTAVGVELGSGDGDGLGVTAMGSRQAASIAARMATASRCTFGNHLPVEQSASHT